MRKRKYFREKVKLSLLLALYEEEVANALATLPHKWSHIFHVLKHSFRHFLFLQKNSTVGMITWCIMREN